MAAVSIHVRNPDLDQPPLRPIRLLADAGFDVHVISVGDAAARHDDGATSAWVETGPVTVGQRIARLRPEIVFVHATAYGVGYGMLGRRSWIRNPILAASGHKRAVQRLLLSRFDAVSIGNPAHSREWRLRPGQLVDLPSPVDLRWWGEPVARDPNFWQDRGLEAPAGAVLTYAAGITAGKRQTATLDALAPLLRDQPGMRLVFAGAPFEPDEYDRLERLRSALSLGDQVVHLPHLWRDDLRQLLAWTDVGVLNTVRETQCKVIYETLAAGVPMVIPDIPELTLQFPDLPAHTDGSALRANVEELLDNPTRGRSAIDRSRPQLAWVEPERHDQGFATTLTRLLGRPVTIRPPH